MIASPFKVSAAAILAAIAVVGCSPRDLDLVGSYRMRILLVPGAKLSLDDQRRMAIENKSDDGVVLKEDHTYSADDFLPVEGNWHSEMGTVVLEPSSDHSYFKPYLTKPLVLGVSSDRELLVLANGPSSATVTIFKRESHGSRQEHRP